MSDNLSAALASLKIDRQHERAQATRRVRWIVLLVVLLIVGSLAWLFLAPLITSRLFVTRVDVTEVSLVSPAQSSVTLSATGYVVPQVVSAVAAKIPGRIAEVLVSEGSIVNKGDVLVRLEDADSKSAIAAAKARMLAAQAESQTARANVAEAKLKAARERTLVHHGAAMPANAEDLEARVKVLEAALQAAEAKTVAAQAEIRTLEINQDYLVVRAPIAGRVISVPASVGETVGVSFESPILELADFSSILLEADVPEARLHLVQPGGPAEIILDAFPQKRFRGEVKMISPKVNRAKATAMVKVAFVDGVEGVLPEMSGRVSFLAKQLDANALQEAPKLVVPSSAVSERGGTPVVFEIVDNRVRMKSVVLGPAVGGGYELVQGPPAGTPLVNEPSDNLRDGQQVKGDVDDE